MRGTLLLWLAVSILLLATKGLEGFSYRGESGYGDGPAYSAIQLFSRTGGMYPDPSATATLGAIRAYGPLYYLIFYTFKVAPPSGWDLMAMRAAVVAAVLFGAFAVSQLAVKTFAMPSLRWLVFANILSLPLLRSWITQLRGDFFAISLNVLALLLITSTGAAHLRLTLLAGLVAGLAPCIKFSYLTGCLTAVLWLLLWGQWRRALLFVSGVTTTLILVFGVTAWREPLFLRHVLLFSRTIVTDHYGQFYLFLDVFRDPLMLTGISGAVTILPRWRDRRISLLLIYVAVSGIVAVLTSAHAGANVNYYFESAMALMVFAALGVSWLIRLERQMAPGQPEIRMLVTCGFLLSLVFFVKPLLVNGHRDTSASHIRVSLKNRRFEQLRQLRDLRILSFSPDATMATGAALIEDPYGFTSLSIRGVIDISPLRSQIEAREFDVVVFDQEHTGWRGIPTVDPALVPVVQQHYSRHCEISGIILFLRKEPDPTRNAGIIEKIRHIECR